MIGLSDQAAVGPSLGRVVVGDGGPQALGFAFRAARRRGIGVTIVDATPSNGDGPKSDDVLRLARGPVVMVGTGTA